jgi:hypothetical protein
MYQLSTYFTHWIPLKLFKVSRISADHFQKSLTKISVLLIHYACHLFLIHASSLVFYSAKGLRTLKHTPPFSSSSDCSLWHSLTSSLLTYPSRQTSSLVLNWAVLLTDIHDTMPVKCKKKFTAEKIKPTCILYGLPILLPFCCWSYIHVTYIY